MAARSRRRTSRARGTGSVTTGVTKDKATESLQLVDVLCCVCRGVLVEPVSLPCRHRFCRACWLATDALRCPLCRMRVGSWLRESTRRNLLVDAELWRIIRDKFPKELASKLNGEEVDLPDEVRAPRLSAPGEIRAEYEAELVRERGERLQLEQQAETERLAKELQDQEEAVHQAYLEKLKQDEELAKQLQAKEDSCSRVSRVSRANGSLRAPIQNHRPKCTNGKRATIDRYLVKKAVAEELTHKESPLITEDEGSSNSSALSKKEAAPSPECAPRYGRFLKDYLDKKLRHLTGSMLHKETTGTIMTWVPPTDSMDSSAQKEFSVSKIPLRTKGAKKQLCPEVPSCSIVHSMPVSLPYSGILNQSVAALASGGGEKYLTASNDSVDSMRQEMCYFKPIHATVSTCRSKSEPSEAVRVRAVRGAPSGDALESPARPPDFLRGLQLLRGKPTTVDTPSAFVCLLTLLDDAATCDISEVKCKTQKTANEAPICELSRKNISSFRKKPTNGVEPVSASGTFMELRRTRSTGNIPKLINESTPKKLPPKKKRSVSKRKGKSKSEGKKANYTESLSAVDFEKVNLAAKNLSSPFDTCDALSASTEKCRKEGRCGEHGHTESNNNHSSPRKSARRVSCAASVVALADAALRVEQERKDLELALRVEAEWNGGYALRRAPAKRRHHLPHPLMLARAKKMKV